MGDAGIYPSRASVMRIGQAQTGFTYLGLLFAIALFTVSGALIQTLWSIERQRQREKELLFVGDQFRSAIASYYELSPGAVKHYPKKLGDLILDSRFVMPVRHLRKIYRDPITEQAEWGLVMAPDGNIMGVHSQSPRRPLKKQNFTLAKKSLEGKPSYSEWCFIYSPAAEDSKGTLSLSK